MLLVHRTFQVHAEVGFGDFAVDKWGGLRRRGEREVVPYIYAGLQLITPALLAGTPEGAFSMNRAWDTAMAAGRLRAVVHDGLWFHLSTPADLAEAESILQARATGDDALNLFTIPPGVAVPGCAGGGVAGAARRDPLAGRARADPAADPPRRPRAGRGVPARVRRPAAAAAAHHRARRARRGAADAWPARSTCRRRWSRRSGWRR